MLFLCSWSDHWSWSGPLNETEEMWRVRLSRWCFCVHQLFTYRANNVSTSWTTSSSVTRMEVQPVSVASSVFITRHRKLDYLHPWWSEPLWFLKASSSNTTKVVYIHASRAAIVAIYATRCRHFLSFFLLFRACKESWDMWGHEGS